MDPIVGGREHAHDKKGDWSDTVRKNGSLSGKLKNPGKRFFLELAKKNSRTRGEWDERQLRLDISS